MSSTRPKSAKIHAIVLAIGGLLTGYFGLSANGYLVPAVMLFILAALLWTAKAMNFFKYATLINLLSGLLLVLVLAFGDSLGARKLDVSGVALLTNLFTGGPILSLAALGILTGLRKGKPLALWFDKSNAKSA